MQISNVDSFGLKICEVTSLLIIPRMTGKCLTFDDMCTYS